MSKCSTDKCMVKEVNAPAGLLCAGLLLLTSQPYHSTDPWDDPKPWPWPSSPAHCGPCPPPPKPSSTQCPGYHTRLVPCAGQGPVQNLHSFPSSFQGCSSLPAPGWNPALLALAAPAHPPIHTSCLPRVPPKQTHSQQVGATASLEVIPEVCVCVHRSR